MSLKLSSVLAYKKRLWSDVTTKASQYYKGRKRKLDLTHCRSVKVEWNPLFPAASNARWFRRTIAMDKFTMNTVDQCQIMDEMHEREEQPKMTFTLNTKANTTVVFDLRKIRWNHLVHELMLWTDYARTSNQGDYWNAEKFGFGKDKMVQFPYLKAREGTAGAQKEINKFIFFDHDQPLQPEEFFNQNVNRKNGNIDSYPYSPRMEHKYSNEKSPIWRTDFEFLHKSKSYNGLPGFRFDFIVYDDNGLVYPAFNQIPKKYLDQIMENEQCNDLLSEYVYKYYKDTTGSAKQQ